MNKYKVVKPVRINSESYAPGQTVSLSEKEPGLDLLVSSGAIQLVGQGVSKQPVESAKVDISAKPDKKMEEAIIASKKMVAEASLKAKTILDDAKAEAVAIIEDAKKEAKSIISNDKPKAPKSRKKVTPSSK